MQVEEFVPICCCAGLSLFAVVLVCYCREPVSLPTWLVPSDSSGCVIFEGFFFFFGCLNLICSFLHHKVNFEKDCNMHTRLSGFVCTPPPSLRDHVCSLFCPFVFLKGWECFHAVYASTQFGNMKQTLCMLGFSIQIHPGFVSTVVLLLLLLEFGTLGSNVPDEWFVWLNVSMLQYHFNAKITL